ncbi:hypothetical protein [Streptomyces griseosporeus]|uniref:hypothetical protein n=1 Tax=Streptomyces griseosporeus TaxID=1910 RepID=UPI0036F5A181
MSDIEKAAREAVEAADNAEMVRQIAAILAAQQLLAQQQTQAPAPAPRQEFDAKRWLVIGGVGVIGALVLSVFAVAIAVGASCATACLLVLRSMWREYQKGR